MKVGDDGACTCMTGSRDIRVPVRWPRDGCIPM